MLFLRFLQISGSQFFSKHSSMLLKPQDKNLILDEELYVSNIDEHCSKTNVSICKVEKFSAFPDYYL